MMETVGREKIPKSWSYALKATQIAEALDGAPQIPALRVSFHFRLGRWYHTAKNLKNASRPQNICKMGFGAWGEAPPSWWLTIEAVPSELRSGVGGVLLAEGLPRAREWLLKRAGLASDARAQTFTVTFDFGRERVGFEEWQAP